MNTKRNAQGPTPIFLKRPRQAIVANVPNEVVQPQSLGGFQADTPGDYCSDGGSFGLDLQGQQHNYNNGEFSSTVQSFTHGDPSSNSLSWNNQFNEDFTANASFEGKKEEPQGYHPTAQQNANPSLPQGKMSRGPERNTYSMTVTQNNPRASRPSLRQTTLTPGGQLRGPQLLAPPRPRAQLPQGELRAPPPPTGQATRAQAPRGPGQAGGFRPNPRPRCQRPAPPARPTGPPLGPRHPAPRAPTSAFTGPRRPTSNYGNPTSVNGYNSQPQGGASYGCNVPRNPPQVTRYPGHMAGNYHGGNATPRFPTGGVAVRSSVSVPSQRGTHNMAPTPKVAQNAWGSPAFPNTQAPDKDMTATQATPFIMGKQTIDSSMKLITATIEKLKETCVYKEKCGVLCEVIGMVNSAVGCTKGDTVKEFVLKDEEDSIRCVFYEIDRTMPKIIRGQWYRCIGTCEMDTIGEHLKCVSLRHATDAEMKCHRPLVVLCDKSLRQLRRKASDW